MLLLTWILEYNWSKCITWGVCLTDNTQTEVKCMTSAGGVQRHKTFERKMASTLFWIYKIRGRNNVAWKLFWSLRQFFLLKNVFIQYIFVKYDYLGVWSAWLCSIVVLGLSETGRSMGRCGLRTSHPHMHSF